MLRRLLEVGAAVSGAVCTWCARGSIYADGTGCAHGAPPADCLIHGGATDLNLVARGRRAVIKCTHYANSWVVMYADPIGDDKDWSSYTIVFTVLGVGHEQYQVGAQRQTCPHYVYDSLVEDMRNGARPHPSRVPDPGQTRTTPGKELPSV